MKLLIVILVTFTSSMAFSNNKLIYSDSSFIVKVAGDLNEDIIDYLFIDPNHFIQISKIKRKFYLKVPSENNTIKTYPLEVEPESLYKDITGKTYIITKEKAFQISIEPTLIFENSYSKSDFLRLVSSMVFKNKNHTISEYLDSRNKEYGLMQIVNSDSSKILVFKSFEKTRDELYNAERIGKRGGLSSVNSVLNNRPVRTDNKTGNEINQNLDRFKNTNSFDKTPKDNTLKNSLNTISFSVDSLIYTFDLVNEKLISYNVLQKSTTDKSLTSQEGENSQIIKDDVTQIIYQTVFEKGILSIYEINLQDGSLNRKMSLDNVKFEENIKINNGSLFYSKINEGGFHKIYQVSF